MRSLVLAAALTTAACGPALLKLPSGPGSPIDVARLAPAVAQATATCAAIRTLTAVVAVSGSTRGQRLRARLSVGVAVPASVRLEALAPFGEPLFTFVASNDDATLLLSQDNRVLEHGKPSPVLDAVAGVPLDAADLATTLTGCAPPGAVVSGNQFGDRWLVASQDNGVDLYLRRDTGTGPWRLASVARRPPGGTARWRADYEPAPPRSRAIRVISLDPGGGTGRAFDVQLVLSQVDIDMPLVPEVFAVQVPPTARPITLEELRTSGPLNGR